MALDSTHALVTQSSSSCSTCCARLRPHRQHSSASAEGSIVENHSAHSKAAICSTTPGTGPYL
eukprot:4362952-Prymnesium_polylepis.2